MILDSFKTAQVRLLSLNTKKISALMIKFRKYLQVQLASLNNELCLKCKGDPTFAPATIAPAMMSPTTKS